MAGVAPGMASVSFSTSVEEQHENLRRFVDEWRGQVSETLEAVADNGLMGVASRDIADINQDPLHIATDACEDGSLLDLIATDNVTFNKLMTILAYDCLELDRLHHLALTKFCPGLLVFGLCLTGDEAPTEGELQKKFAKSLGFFQELLYFLYDLRAVLVNLVQQLGAIYTNDGHQLSFTSVHLQTAFLSLAEGFAVLVTVDQIVAQNPAIGHSMSLFTRMLHSVRSEPTRFGMVAENVEKLDHAVNDMDNLLIEGLFQRSVQEDFISHSEMVKLKANRQFLDEVLYCLRDILGQVLSRLDSMQERPHDREKIAGLLAMFVFHSWMTAEGPEKRLAKFISEVLKRTPVLHVFCSVRLIPLEFLRVHLPPWALTSSLIKEARKGAAAINSSYLGGLDEALTGSSQTLRTGLVNWLVSFDSTVSPTVQQLAIHAVLGTRLKQLAQGVFLTNRLRHIVRATIDCHVSLQEPISKDQVRSLRHAAELLQAVRAVYHRRNSETAQSITHMIQLAQTQIQKHLLPLKAQLEADLVTNSRASTLHFFAQSLTRGGKDLDSKLQDALAAVNLALEMLQGCASIHRRIVLHLSLDVLCSIQSRLPEETATEIMEMCMLMEMAADIQELVYASTDCSLLYWCREMMPTCFALLYAQTSEAHSLQYVINAFKDGIRLLKAGNAEDCVIESYEKELEDTITNEVIAPLCRDVETDLRLHVHSAHLKGSVNVNPTKTGVRDLSCFLQVKPLRLATKYIHIKRRVESYLNAAFYDHTAVALHNWKTYGEMRQLAEQKYGLELDDIHLPCQTLEQGVDVLEVMRNIHIFVASYTYNLNTQVFIERLTNASYRKHINTISVKHVANSIRTHGTGIISTTVNFTYQYLAQKFVAFSQFLFDDHIKSRLIKERRFFKENKGTERKEYPVARAQKLSQDIKKLGVSESGHSYLDQFRQLVAEMGNALGFVRMVRMGGLSYCSAALGFVQEGKNISFELASKDLGMAPGAVKAGKHLDMALESQNMSADGTNYFSILVNVFSQELRGDDNLHLREFFLIVPALMVNAVEAMLHAKAKLFKRGRSSADALFTDDGFVLGVAYLLKVLGQDKQFDSLHWFETARKHYRAERAHLEESLDMDNIGSGLLGLQIWSQKLASISEEDAHKMQLAAKRVGDYLTELELIDFNFSGARIFFHFDA